ncbi:DUF6507 family protein [Streptomyces sp. NPDC002676]
MTGWDIDPAGVISVLSKTRTAAKNLADAHSAMQDNLEEAASAAGTLTSQYGPYTSTAGLVGSALAQFLQHWNPELLHTAQRAANSINGADQATGFYIQGDLEQAANAQHKAAQEPKKIDMPGKGGTGHRTKDRSS